MSSDVLLEETLIKRSQQKKRTSPLNYKERLFVLTDSSLCYYDGRAEKRSRKGCIELRHIRCVEIVKTREVIPCQNKYPFQVVYDSNILYVFAPSNSSRSLWVQTMKEKIRFNLSVLTKFHPQFWVEGAWLCCRQGDKLAPGCELFSSVGDISRKPLPSPPGQDTKPPCADDEEDEEEEEEKDEEEEEEQAVIAMYDFAGAEPHDLPLVKGAEYVIVSRCDANWYLARNQHGEEGYIPSNYITDKKSDNLEQFAWFSKNVNRTQAEQLLRKEDKEGGFIVRNSSSPGAFTVSLYNKSAGDGIIKHYHIKETEASPRMFYLAEKHLFTCLPDLIEYHKHNAAGLVTRLRYPVGKQDKSAPSTAGFSYDKWEVNPSDLTFMKELGSGQYGVVRLGMWRGIHKVAIKAIREGAMLEEDFIEEARLMMRLSHPHLVQLYGLCSQRPLLMVCEFMELGCLLNVLRQRRGRLEPGALGNFCLDVCLGMEHLEKHGFIHRDLASRNCLVNESLVVKVADFGMARYVLDNQYTSSKGAQFPVRWSPPEVLHYCKYSSQSDVWSFGVLMWEVFTEGQMPFEHKTNQEVVVMVTQGHRLYRPKLATPTFYELMQRCWHERPEKRPSFSEINQVIFTALEGD